VAGCKEPHGEDRDEALQVVYLSLGNNGDSHHHGGHVLPATPEVARALPWHSNHILAQSNQSFSHKRLLAARSRGQEKNKPQPP